jgi:hypothetical protein
VLTEIDPCNEFKPERLLRSRFCDCALDRSLCSNGRAPRARSLEVTVRETLQISFERAVLSARSAPDHQERCRSMRYLWGRYGSFAELVARPDQIRQPPRPVAIEAALHKQKAASK